MEDWSNVPKAIKWAFVYCVFCVSSLFLAVAYRVVISPSLFH